MVLAPETPKSQGPIGFCTFKASRWQPDVTQPLSQFTTTKFFSTCMEIASYLWMKPA